VGRRKSARKRPGRSRPRVRAVHVIRCAPRLLVRADGPSARESRPGVAAPGVINHRGCSADRRTVPNGRRRRARHGVLRVPGREVCESWSIAGQAVLLTPHCCLPHTVCNVVTSFSARRSKPARVKEVLVMVQIPTVVESDPPAVLLEDRRG
jgi:hypothetical protein